MKWIKGLFKRRTIDHRPIYRRIRNRDYWGGYNRKGDKSIAKPVHRPVYISLVQWERDFLWRDWQDEQMIDFKHQDIIPPSEWEHLLDDPGGVCADYCRAKAKENYALRSSS